MPENFFDIHLESLLGLAHEHGSYDDPDHEVGDLQDLLRAAYGQLYQHQRHVFFHSDAVRNLLESTGRDDRTISQFLDAPDVDGEAHTEGRG